MNAAFFTVNGYISLLFLLFWGAAAVVTRPVGFAQTTTNRDDGTDFKPPTHGSSPSPQKVLAGERLSAEDGLALYQSHDLLAVGWLANHVREQRHGNLCYYNINRHINPTNVCVAHCRLCAFGRSPDAPGAYTFALEEIWSRAAARSGGRRNRISHRRRPASRSAVRVLPRPDSRLKQRFPQVHLKAFTMVEVGYYARISKLSIRDTLVKMKEAGVDSLPGGGAEIFHPRVRKIICDHKVSGQMWLQIARTAHEVGLRSNATMLYGHIETAEERVDHLLQLRELQDKTHGFVAFIPLAFHPANTALSHLPKPTGFDDLKTIAVSRLLLDNFEHIKAYWIMLTPRIAQIALRFGANDLDGTVVEEKIYHDAGATTPEHLSRAELERLIRAAGRVPVERDTLYNRVDREKMPFPVATFTSWQRRLHPRNISDAERLTRSSARGTNLSTSRRRRSRVHSFYLSLESSGTPSTCTWMARSRGPSSSARMIDCQSPSAISPFRTGTEAYVPAAWREDASQRFCGCTRRVWDRCGANNRSVPTRRSRNDLISSSNACWNSLMKIAVVVCSDCTEQKTRFQPVLLHDFIQIPRDVDQFKPLPRLVA